MCTGDRNTEANEDVVMDPMQYYDEDSRRNIIQILPYAFEIGVTSKPQAKSFSINSIGQNFVVVINI